MILLCDVWPSLCVLGAVWAESVHTPRSHIKTKLLRRNKTYLLSMQHTCSFSYCIIIICALTFLKRNYMSKDMNSTFYCDFEQHKMSYLCLFFIYYLHLLVFYKLLVRASLLSWSESLCLHDELLCVSMNKKRTTEGFWRCTWSVLLILMDSIFLFFSIQFN